MISHKVTLSLLGLLAFYGSHAQSYTLVPGDSIVANIMQEDLTVFNFEQQNATADTLSLTLQKLDAVVPADWEAAICDNAMCYADLHETSIQTVFPGEYGLASLHITAHSPGTAVVRYLVWDNGDPSIVDTLTWVITSDPLSVAQPGTERFDVLQNVNGLVVKFNQPADRSIRVFNANGQPVAQLAFTNALVNVETNTLASGLYFVQAQSGNSVHIFKLVVQR